MRRTIPFLAVLVATTACGGGVRVSTDFDPEQNFAGYETYVWAPPPKTGDPRLDSDLTVRRIQSAVDEVLADKGFRPVTGDEQPDFMVGYYAAVEGRVDVQTVSTYHGWGWGPYYGGMYPSTQTRYYNQGTLIIDIADAEREQLVWRGTGESEVHQHSDPDRRQRALVDAVHQIMQGFPPQ
jgi:hypothetical protein